MKALFVRLRKFTGVRGVLVLVVGGAGAITLLALGGLRMLPGAGAVLGMAVSALVMIVVAAAKYQHSASTVSHSDVVLPLLRSGAKFCLILRPFGQDAEIVLPKAQARRRVGNGAFTRNVTMEQVVTTAARTTLDMDTYGIVDQRTTLAPPGPILMRAPDDEWQSVAQRLIRRAHVIVLIVPPDREFGDGFFWEIEQIRRYQAQSRVVILLPPDGDPAVLRRACLLLALLDGPLDSFKVHEYEMLLPADTLVISHFGPKWWEPVDSGRRVVVADVTYLDVLEVAMREIDQI